MCVCVCGLVTLYWYVGSSLFHGSGLLVLFQLNIQINQSEFLHARLISLLSHQKCQARYEEKEAPLLQRMSGCPLERWDNAHLYLCQFFLAELRCVGCSERFSDCNPSASQQQEQRCSFPSQRQREDEALGFGGKGVFKVSRIRDLQYGTKSVKVLT